jgi:hypothetical protein
MIYGIERCGELVRCDKRVGACGMCVDVNEVLGKLARELPEF